MIITRTPFRISFFGGGTDFPEWYNENGGSVLSATIDKYCYITCRRLPPFFGYKHRIVYSRYEQVNDIDEIAHPAVRESFRFMDIKEGLEIHHDGDLPARSGLGSSSSFTVGLLNTLYALKGKMVTKKRLALDAIHVEQEMIKENVGSQDQVAVAYGGINKISFSGKHDIDVTPITLTHKRIEDFEDCLMLFFTGFSRIASEIEGDKIKNIKKNKEELFKMHGMVEEAIHILSENRDFDGFGELLHESWRLKKRLSDRVTTSSLDEIYETALRNGAKGGKLLGAGGGGFILFFAKPENRNRLKKSLAHLLHVPFSFENTGSQIIYYSE